MSKNELIDKPNNEVGFNNNDVIRITNVKGYFFIELANGFNVITDGNKFYDVSAYNKLMNIFKMGDRLCAALTKYSEVFVIDLNTNEVLLNDTDIYHVSREDDIMLWISFNSRRPINLYNIETKKYIMEDQKYQIEEALGNNLYSFRLKNSDQTDFHDIPRWVVNSFGETIMKDVKGFVELYEDYLIVNGTYEISVIKINNNEVVSINTIAKTDNLLTKPEYYNGHIYVIEKGSVKVYNLELELVNEYKIDGLKSIADFTISGKIFMLSIPWVIDGEHINRHLYLNLDTGNIINHIRIVGSPFSGPKTFVGIDGLDCVDSYEYGKTYELNDYHFYDGDFNEVVHLKGNNLYEISTSNFIVDTWNGHSIDQMYINIETKVVKESNYEYIKFIPQGVYGYGLNKTTGMIDIIDHDLNVIFSNIDYKGYGLEEHDIYNEVAFFVIGDYVGIKERIYDGTKTHARHIIQNSQGEVLLDSMTSTCSPMGNLIQITSYDEAKYLDTKTGEIGTISVNLPVNKEGKIALDQVNDINDIFKINYGDKSSALKLLPDNEKK